uniref:2-aminoethanethiol dioxygenase n=1 Tax=Tabanus bromius TaxID=304241 RepID=A0A0K8TL44_TABBR
MSGLFAKIVKHSLATFDRKNAAALSTNLHQLKQLMDQLTAKDLNIDPFIMSEEAFGYDDKAPCTFVRIFEHEDVSMSVFILRGGYTMPLHDHPVMHGILKTLSGALLVRSYTAINEVPYSRIIKEVPVKAEEPKLINSTSECATLTPTECNYHEISAINGVAAFFDILSPPYDTNIPIYGRRRCNFYRKLPQDSPDGYTLERIPTPISYYCDSAVYVTPDFLKDYETRFTSQKA